MIKPLQTLNFFIDRFKSIPTRISLSELKLLDNYMTLISQPLR